MLFLRLNGEYQLQVVQFQDHLLGEIKIEYVEINNAPHFPFFLLALHHSFAPQDPRCIQEDPVGSHRCLPSSNVSNGVVFYWGGFFCECVPVLPVIGRVCGSERCSVGGRSAILRRVFFGTAAFITTIACRFQRAVT